MSDIFNDPELLPTFIESDLEPPDAADQLRTVEEDVDTYPAEVDLVVDPELPPIGRGYAFDPRTRSFVRGVNGGVLRTHGVDTMKVTILKCLYTQRGAHPIYSGDFGMVDPEGIIGYPASEVAVGEYESMVREALTLLPRVSDVANYHAEFSTTGDRVALSFDVVLDDATVIPFEDVLL